MSKVLACLPKIPLCDDTGAVNISELLALMRWIPGMSSVHLSYLMALDDGVSLDGDGAEQMFNLTSAANPQYIATNPAETYAIHTTATMICAAYTALLMIIKTNQHYTGEWNVFLTYTQERIN